VKWQISKRRRKTSCTKHGDDTIPRDKDTSELTQSMRLQLGLNEVAGPGVNGWCDALKYQCIPLFPDIPACYHKDLHEYP
jgi:hypothetical protein